MCSPKSGSGCLWETFFSVQVTPSVCFSFKFFHWLWTTYLSKFRQRSAPMAWMLLLKKKCTMHVGNQTLLVNAHAQAATHDHWCFPGFLLQNRIRTVDLSFSFQGTTAFIGDVCKCVTLLLLVCVTYVYCRFIWFRHKIGCALRAAFTSVPFTKQFVEQVCTCNSFDTGTLRRNLKFLRSPCVQCF